MLLEKRILETGSRPQAGAKAQPPLLVDFVVTPGGFSRATADRGREDEGKVGSAWKGCLASRPGSLSHIGGPLPLEISWDRDRSRQISSGSPPMET